MIPSPPTDDGTPEPYRVIFFDADGKLIYDIIGLGVVFRTRDFEAWRKKAKKENAAAPIPDFQFAPFSEAGVATPAESFLSPLTTKGPQSRAEALITKESGFAPDHPYHAGSGDHVNANHVADAAMQFAHLNRGGSLTCAGGHIVFRRFVELGRPFQITQTPTTGGSNTISMGLHQGDHSCTDITLSLKTSDGI